MEWAPSGVFEEGGQKSRADGSVKTWVYPLLLPVNSHGVKSLGRAYSL